MTMVDDDKVRQEVRKDYAKIATSQSQGCGCSGSSCCSSSPKRLDDMSTQLDYSKEEQNSAPDGSNMGLGCGNPQAIANIKTGETVLDLGSGGGFDCFLAAKQVGANGKVIGVDMTPEMVSKARENAKKGNYQNVEFRLGEIENLPVADETVNVIISNCVVNLSPDKAQVFREAYRALKKGGRLAISDTVLTAELPEKAKKDLALYSACVSGASYIKDLEQFIKAAGFKNIKITPKGESKEFIKNWSSELKAEDFIVSANIEAVK